MNISPEYLARLREDAENRKSAKMAEFHQIIGAISILDALISQTKQPEPDETEEEQSSSD